MRIYTTGESNHVISGSSCGCPRTPPYQQDVSLCQGGRISNRYRGLRKKSGPQGLLKTGRLPPVPKRKEKSPFAQSPATIDMIREIISTAKFQIRYMHPISLGCHQLYIVIVAKPSAWLKPFAIGLPSKCRDLC